MENGVRFSPEAPHKNGIYRELRHEDYKDIANYINLHNTRQNGIWCINEDQTATQRDIQLHELTLRARGLGKSRTQIHRGGDGRFLSYIGGYKRLSVATYTMAVINLDEKNPRDVFRHDSAVFLQKDLLSGIKKVRVSMSSDTEWCVDWAEQEVGMKRIGNKNLWVADRETMENYVDEVIGNNES